MLGIDVDVPFATFRRPHAWSLYETFPLPPPSTLYGFLLSFLGRGLRESGSLDEEEPHGGIRLGLARLGPEAAKGVVLRKQAQRKYHKDHAALRSASPAPEEVLCDLRLRIWVDSSLEANAEQSLERALAEAFIDPRRITRRIGALCLGESRDLVNRIARATSNAGGGVVMVPAKHGALTMPLWAGHRRRGGGKPRWQSFELRTVDDIPVSCGEEWLCEPLRPNPDPSPSASAKPPKTRRRRKGEPLA